ncbi:MAG TPA: sulfite oxidase [Kiloniellales bacterium]|nr:sulfite oxidase [Kiloniellales bacterium]
MQSRRAFLKGTALAATGVLLRAPFPARAAESGLAQMAEKDGLVLLGEEPLVAETPAHLLDDAVTPTERMFVRLNGLLPQSAVDLDASGWTLTIDGEVERPLRLTLDQLQRDFETVSANLVLECAGNGRAFFQPPVEGNAWTWGGVGCPRWTGVRLWELLMAAGLEDSAVYTGHYGNDPHLSGDPTKHAISRGIPIEKALEEWTLIAWAMNGQPLGPLHGFPLRLVVPGYPGSVSQKFLTRIWVRDRVHDGEKMLGQSYRLPAHPVAPGSTVPDGEMEILGAIPVKSLITSPADGATVPAGRLFALRGHAWSGKGTVRAMHLSFDYGQSWVAAGLSAPANPFAWQRWVAEITLPTAGRYELWARATDPDGVMQPPVPPGWNPQGYANNMMHRIVVVAV